VASGDQSVLDDLGVLNSSVFLVNCTIWVEGITDRLYLRRFLELHWERAERNAPPSEDLHFAFVEYSGANIRHWRFSNEVDDDDERIGAARVCGNAIVIADLDGGEKRWRDAALRDELGERFVLLEVREIENLLAPSTIWSVVRSYEQNPQLPADPPFGDRAYRQLRLGSFIERQLESQGGSSRRGGYAEASGTLKRKSDFARRAVDVLTSWEDLSPDAQSLTERIATFIDSNMGE